MEIVNLSVKCQNRLRPWAMAWNLLLSAMLCFMIVFQAMRIISGFDQVRTRRQLNLLNILREHTPPVDYLVQKHQGHQTLEPDILARYVYYYEKVVGYMPLRPDAHGMLGYFYYHQGRLNEAAASYQRALEINPTFFWFHYNLGVIFLKKGNYAEAVDSFKKAVESDPQTALQFILTSKEIYLPLVTSRKGQWEDLKQQWETDRQHCLKLVVFSQYYQAHPLEERNSRLLNDLILEMF